MLKPATVLFIALGSVSGSFAQRGATPPAPTSVGAALDREISQLLKDSFAWGHHAAAALTTENSLDMVSGAGPNKVPRVFALAFAATHAFDEYGQMEEYLRMNGIVPPASRAN